MPIGTIAAALVTALATKAFEKLGEKTTDTVYDKVAGLFKPDELTTLDLFKENPADAKLQGKLEAKLEDRLPQHPGVAAELQALLARLPPRNDNSANFNVQFGETNTNIQGNQNSPVNFNAK